MLSFRHGAIALLAVFAGATPAVAAELREYDQAAFAAAQAQGRPILIDVHAWWCPVCAQQNHIIKQVVTAPAFDKLIVFRVDYDKQKPVWKAMGVHKQATLIGYHHGREVARLAYRTNGDEIRALLDSTVRG